MTDYTVKTAQDQFKAWTALEEELLVKFMDGNVKVKDEAGNYKMTVPGGDIPASPKHPAQRERWLKGIVNDHGETLQVK